MKQLVTLLLCVPVLAHSADATTTSAVNSAYVSGRSMTSASVAGPLGFSQSFATGTNTAVANGAGSSIAGPAGTITMSGLATNLSTGYAYNLSSGAGNGTSSIDGLAQSYVKVGAEYYGPGQWVIGGGVADGGYNSRDGTSISVIAGKNTGATAYASGEHKFNGVGNVQGTLSNNAGSSLVDVKGNVTGTHSSNAVSVTGKLTVDGIELTPAQTVTSSSTGLASIWLELTDPK